MKSIGTIVIGLLICIAACTLMFKRDIYSARILNDGLAYADKDRELSVIFVASLIGLIGAGVFVVGVYRSLK